jgi:hypothetical protein
MLGTPMTNENNWYGGLVSSGPIDGDTLKRHLVIHGGSGLRFHYANQYGNENGTITSTITVAAGLQLPDGTIVPVYFNGALTVDIAPGQYVASDPISASVAAGTYIYSRTWVQTDNPGTGVWPIQGPPHELTVTAWGESGYAANGVTYGDLSKSGSFTPRSISGFAPFLITGNPVDPAFAVIGCRGDSIASGYGDTDNISDYGRGWPRRASADRIPVVNVAMSGSQYTSGITALRSAYMSQCTDVFDEGGINDINAGVALATLQASSLSIAKRDSLAGVRVWRSTLTPYTTSTDTWATTDNQTVVNATYETHRTDFNDWVRDGAPIDSTGTAIATGTSASGTLRAGDSGHPYAGTFDITPAVESGINSGKWIPGLVCLTGSPLGLHPNSAGAAAIAALDSVQAIIARMTP